MDWNTRGWYDEVTVTLVVSLGLGRFVADDPIAERQQALVSIVQSGCCSLVRDVILERLNGSPAPPRVIEAFAGNDGRIETRSLANSEAEPILADVREVFADTGSSASFAHPETDRLGIDGVCSIALEFNSAEPEAEVEVRIDNRRHLIASLDRSQRNFVHNDPNCEAAWNLHWLARRHRLVVHSE